MDKIDKKLLSALIHNSRMPITRLAKKLCVSREVVTYRLNRLVKEGIILNFFADINTEALGFIGAAFFVIIKATRHKEFEEFISKADYVSWVAEWSSTFSFGMTIVGKTVEELDSRYQTIVNKFKEDLINHKFILHRKNYFYHEKYFGAKSVLRAVKQPAKAKIDNKDKIILKELSKNSRISSTKLAKKLKLSAPAVAQRIKNLEKNRFINKYSIFVDLTKLNMYQYSVFIDNKDLHDKNKLKSFLSEHKRVNFIADYIGDPFLEFGVFVKEPYEVRPILLSIEEKFPDNKFVKVALMQREFVSVGPPSCVFK